MRTAAFNLALFLDCLAVTTPPCLYGLGACVLLGKAVPALRGTGVEVGCGVITVAWLAATLWRFTRGRRFTPGDVLAWLDLHNRAGGRILAGEHITPRIVPGVRLRPFLKRLPIPLLFTAVCLIVPPMQPEEGRARALVEPALERLAEAVAVSEETDALAQAEADQLRRHIAEVRRLAETRPEAAMEALAALPERLDAARAERLDAVADAIEKALDLMDASRRGEPDGGDGLRESLQRLAETGGGWESLPEAVRQAAEAQGGMNHAALEEMLGALESLAGSAEGNAAASRSGQDGSETPGNAEGAASERLASVREILDNMQLSRTGTSGASGIPGAAGGSAGADEAGRGVSMEGAGDAPGSGGISRGPGGAPLWISNPVEGAVTFDYRPLPPGDGGTPGELLKRERTAPDEDWREDPEAPARSAVDAPAAVRGGGGRTAPGPSGERAVTRYFEALRRGE